MNNINYDEHIKLKPGDKIHLITYYDHGQTKESLEEIRKKPLLLVTIGKIVNLHADDPFYAIINNGALNERYKRPNWKDIVQKSAIKEMRVFGTIPEGLEEE